MSLTETSKFHEECGVFGLYAPEPCDLSMMTYCGLYSLQHRGQESCGMVINDDGLFSVYKDKGLLNQVFTKSVLDSFPQGKISIGHVRYSTSGGNGRENSQPIVVNHIKGHMALAHNGNLVNSTELRDALELQGSIFHSTSDTEVISYVITKERLTAPSIEQAVNRAMDRIRGAYSLAVMSPTKLIAVRDPFGFRPLCYGVTDNGTYVISSESCALDASQAHFIRDLDPGEILIIDENGPRSIRDHCNTAPRRMCIFEYIYFSRPDSILDGVGVHEARMRAGACLARSYPVDADIVIGVPDSGLDAAVGYAKESGIPYGIGFIKNKYIGRTFIAPTQKSREEMVHLKLNPIAGSVRGKKIVMIDDSIVRGTTSAAIVKLLRSAGAKEVHVRISAPPFLNPCYYGTDIDSREHLIACHYSVEEICRLIGADSLGYLKVEDLPILLGQARGSEEFCDACFSGRYPTEVPSSTAKSRFENRLSERKEKKHLEQEQSQ